MKLWILEPREPRDPRFNAYDTAQGVVVRAETEAEARVFANGCCGDECEHWYEGPEQQAWLCPSVTTCEELTPSGPPGVILVDFKAG
jgi:hypothetical protein